jgi:hypothetical protein
MQYILTGLACAVYFARRSGARRVDVGGTLLPLAGTLAICALLLLNFAHQSHLDQAVAAVCIGGGVLYALLGRRAAPRSA